MFLELNLHDLKYFIVKQLVVERIKLSLKSKTL